MPGSKTAYLSAKILRQCLGTVPFTPPGTIYFALSSAAFTPDATGANCTELAPTGGYVRISADNSALWSPATAASPSVTANLSDLSWSAATADWPLPPLSVYVGDAATAGNLLYGADLSSAVAVLSADAFTIAAGTFVFTED